MAAVWIRRTRRARGAHRANRAVLAALGLLLLAAGGGGVAAGVGAFGDDIRARSVLPPYTRNWVSRHDWFWVAVAAGSILIALLALRWLVAQTSDSRVGELQLESDRRHGRTVVASRAVTDAVAGEIDSYRGVRRAAAHLLGDPGAPTLLVHAVVDSQTDPAELRTRIQTEAVAHARQALDAPDLAVRLELRLAGTSGRDVR